MTASCIDIKQHELSHLEAKIYEWAVVIGGEAIDGHAGESSIAECLSAAIGSMPLEIFLVEIRYRGIRMGTFKVDDVKKTPGLIADSICIMYAALAPSL